MDILQKIQDSYSILTRKQKGIADYLLENPEEVCYTTLAQLSHNVPCSELTLLRFCKKIGCRSYMNLKNEFRTYTSNMIRQVSSAAYFVPLEPASDQPEKEALLTTICIHEADTLSDYAASFRPEELFSAAEKIKKSKQIYIFAHDISKVPGSYLESRLKLLYFNAVLVDLEDLGETQNRLSSLTKEDLVIFFSFPKYYYPMGSIAKKAAASCNSVITITDSIASPAAKYSSQILFCRTETKMFYNSLTMPMALLNLLSSCLVIDMVPESERKEFKNALSS